MDKKKLLMKCKDEKPEFMKAPESLNKLQITNNFKTSNNQEVDPGYNSNDEKEKTLDFDKEIQNIKDMRGVDLAFVVDCTGSMMPFIKSIKELMRKIIRDGENFVSQFTKTSGLFKISIVAYRDHDEKSGFITDVSEFSDPATARIKIKGLSAMGGADLSEAVFDALDKVTKLKWRDESHKFLIHFLDGPPHGKQYVNNPSDTKYPDGCPCGISEEDIFYKLRDYGLKYMMIKMNDDIEKMISEFSQFFDVEVIKLNIPYDNNIKKTQYQKKICKQLNRQVNIEKQNKDYRLINM